MPTSDAKDCPATDVQASVSTQQLSLKGISVKVWVVTYTGQRIGSGYNKDGVHSTGPETDTYLYDPAYGIYLGGSWKWSFNGVETGGGGTWTEGYEENTQFEDTSLTFTSTVTIQLQPSTNLAITIDGVKYNSNQLPTTFKWFIGTTHSLVVNSTIMGSDGVRYVFGQWSDGSTESSRNFISVQDTTLTATFKTQYLLTVVSDVGNPQGSGWYDAGTQATFSVLSTPQAESGFLGALGGKLAFQGWSGDSNAGSPSATINMDGPKTVTAMWTVDNTQPYIILAGIAAVIVVVAALALFMKRRKH